jgi:hypothetical protein
MSLDGLLRNWFWRRVRGGVADPAPAGRGPGVPVLASWAGR